MARERWIVGARNIARRYGVLHGWEPHIVTVYRWLNEGIMPGRRWNGKWAVRDDELRRFRPPKRGRPRKAAGGETAGAQA